MKSFKHFLAEKNAYKIYCDMDGVLVDFMQGMNNELNLKKDPSQDEINNFLSTEHGISKEFWSSLEWMPGGKQLWNTLKKLNTEILSACPGNCKSQPGVVSGKKIWLKNNLKITKGINIVLRKDKKNFAGPNAILIDDYKKNIKEWEAAGGVGIHHTNVKKTLSELEKYENI